MEWGGAQRFCELGGGAARPSPEQAQARERKRQRLRITRRLLSAQPLARESHVFCFLFAFVSLVGYGYLRDYYGAIKRTAITRAFLVSRFLCASEKCRILGMLVFVGV